ncbi:MAG TPA: aminotransferase DegT [Rhodobacter sp.]|nr:aminotransferase DegT [Rhodobacter sp.]
MSIGLVDLARQRAAIEPGVTRALARVLDHGGFINGPEVAALETALAARVGLPHVVACANGTDALQLLLRGWGVGQGDCVYVPSLTFAATAEAVVLAGAVPVFVDVTANGTICPQSLRDALAVPRAERSVAVIAVDLFSLPADHAALSQICAEAGLALFYDAAHSIGSDSAAGACGSLGDGAATSFYPSKALGCYGDGGAVFTRHADFAARMRAIANHGLVTGSPAHGVVGTNSRLDTMQAAILLEKLKIFDAETKARRAIAARYAAALASVCTLPAADAGADPVWSYYAIRHADRDGLQRHLLTQDIRTVIYYRTPTHEHPAFAGYATAPAGLPATKAFADSMICLPLHPYLSDAEVDRVIAGVLSFSA